MKIKSKAGQSHLYIYKWGAPRCYRWGRV